MQLLTDYIIFDNTKDSKKTADRGKKIDETRKACYYKQRRMP